MVTKWGPACGRNHDVGTWGQTQSLAKMNLRHEPEVLREIFSKWWVNYECRCGSDVNDVCVYMWCRVRVMDHGRHQMVSHWCRVYRILRKNDGHHHYHRHQMVNHWRRVYRILRKKDGHHHHRRHQWTVPMMRAINQPRSFNTLSFTIVVDIIIIIIINHHQCW